MIPDRIWQLEAACRTLTTSDMFPDHLDNPALKQHVHAIARNYCGKCPVWRECQQVSNKGAGGIYAGKIVGRNLNSRQPAAGRFDHITPFPAKARKAFNR